MSCGSHSSSETKTEDNKHPTDSFFLGDFSYENNENTKNEDHDREIDSSNVHTNADNIMEYIFYE